MPRVAVEVCQLHWWGRRLETHQGAEYVLRVCERCGRRELAWSRRGPPPGLGAVGPAEEVREGPKP